MNNFFSAALTSALALIIFFGCQTPDQKLKEQQRQQWESRVSQQTVDLDEKIAQLENRLENLRLRQEGVERRNAEMENSLRAFSERLNQQIASLRSEIQATNAALDKKVAIILDEVSKENERLLQKLRGGSKTGKKTGVMQGYEHVVQSGETLSTISREYGTTVQAIKDANQITDPHSLRVGQKLFIPQ